MKGHKRMRMVTIHGSKMLAGQEAVALRIAASRSFLEKAEVARANRQACRLPDAPERQSVQKAMLLIEHRLVEALWVLARLPGERGIGYAARNGISYMPDRIDNYAAALEGKLTAPPPKPAPPSSKAIDAMHEPLDWLKLLPREQARLLTIGAQSKRGDVSRNISWPRMRHSHPELAGLSTRTCQRRYSDALRSIVAELTMDRLIVVV
jgi:hypothetical protein